MGYWPKDHEQNLRRLADMTRDLDAIREDLIPSLVRDLADDAPDETEQSRSWLNDARVGIGLVMGALDAARDHLPTPKTPTYPTAAEVMEREG